MVKRGEVSERGGARETSSKKTMTSVNVKSTILQTGTTVLTQESYIALYQPGSESLRSLHIAGGDGAERDTFRQVSERHSPATVEESI